jgi:hypothetical protein
MSKIRQNIIYWIDICIVALPDISKNPLNSNTLLMNSHIQDGRTAKSIRVKEAKTMPISISLLSSFRKAMFRVGYYSKVIERSSLA